MMSKVEQVKLSQLTARDLGSLGLESTAYIKPVFIDGKTLHAIHAADGTPLTVVAERETAIATVRQHEMQPVSVH
jgi:hypothetical protein